MPKSAAQHADPSSHTPQQSENHAAMDDDSDAGSTPQESKNGKSTNRSRQAQNRQAQREFRQRKQQYVRDLEARVEALSGDTDHRTSLMLLIVRNLLKENKELREMVRSMSTFIGEGMGSCLPRLGVSETQLKDIVDRGDTDTAYQAFIAVKASKEVQENNPGLALGDPRLRATSTKRKRKEGSLDTPSRRESTDQAPAQESREVLDADVPPTMEDVQEDFNAASNSLWSDMFGGLDPFGNGLSSAPTADPAPRVPTPPILWGSYAPYNADSTSSLPTVYPRYQPTLGNPSQNQTYPSLPIQNNSYALGSQQGGFGLTLPGQIPLYTNMTPMNASPAETSTAKAESSPGAILATRQKHLRSIIAKATKYEGQGSQPGVMTSEQIEERRLLQAELHESMKDDQVPDSDRKVEAAQLIAYHLNNFRSRKRYSLPLSLRPTAIQQSVPHEYAIDGFIYPPIRDRMILFRGQYDLVEAFHRMLNEFQIHGQDVLDHRNWEVSEGWLKDFPILVDDEVYEVANHWRQARGDRLLIRPQPL